MAKLAYYKTAKPPPPFTLTDLHNLRDRDQSGNVSSEYRAQDITHATKAEVANSTFLKSAVLLVTFTEITGLRRHLNNITNTFYVLSEREWFVVFVVFFFW